MEILLKCCWKVLIFCILGCVNCEECFTVDKPADVPCVFPFTYMNTTYSGCTNVGDRDGKLWCATKVGENVSYENSSLDWGFCSSECPDGDVETVADISIRTVDEELSEEDRQCGADETCKHQDKCPQFLEQKEQFEQLLRGSQEYRESLQRIRKSVCNKSKKGVCCPKENKCGRGYSCLKEAQCKYAQDLRKRFKNGDNSAKEELIGLICDRKKRTFCCPDEKIELVVRNIESSKQKNPSWLPGKGSCGIPNTLASRVLSGVATDIGQFPFTALLGYPERKRAWIENKRKWETLDIIKYKCGGTLINHWYIVTAAHCHGRKVTAQMSTVRLGEWEVGRKRDCLLDGDGKETYCTDPVQDFTIAIGQVTVHEGYRKTPTNVENDIALIRLPRPAILNTGVQIVCLPINPAEAARELNVQNLREGLVGKRPNVVGWGYTEYDPWATEQQGDFETTNVASSVQQRLGVPILSSSECTKKFGKFKPNSSQICAGGEKGKDSCKGDSGGPLYLARVEPNGEPKLDGSEPWYLLGLVSFGSRQCGAGKPGVYTRVESFLPWIKKKIGN